MEPKCVPMFFNTLDIIPMNWHLETMMKHGTMNWTELVEGFLLTFNFENDWSCIDEALKAVKTGIFKTTTVLSCMPLDWTTHFQHALEFYNVIAE